MSSNEFIKKIKSVCLKSLKTNHRRAICLKSNLQSFIKKTMMTFWQQKDRFDHDASRFFKRKFFYMKNHVFKSTKLFFDHFINQSLVEIIMARIFWFFPYIEYIFAKKFVENVQYLSSVVRSFEICLMQRFFFWNDKKWNNNSNFWFIKIWKIAVNIVTNIIIVFCPMQTYVLFFSRTKEKFDNAQRHRVNFNK